MPSKILTRLMLIIVAALAIIIGFIGIFLPILPTVPFLLLAAYCLARSSPKLEQRLLDHPRLGPMIKMYRDGKGIPRRAKILSTVSIWFSLTLSMIIVGKIWALLLLTSIGIGVCTYIWRQPDYRLPDQSDR